MQERKDATSINLDKILVLPKRRIESDIMYIFFQYNDALAMHSNQVQQQQMHPAIPPLDRSVPPPPINNINTNDSQ